MGGYIEIEIGGKVRGFRFGLGALGELIDILNIGMDEFDGYIKRNPIKGIPALVYAGAKCHLQDKDLPIDFSKNDVADWIYDLPGGFSDEKIIQLSSAFSKSLEKKVEDVADEDAKKK